MNRFHVHLAVKDLGDSIRFYTSLFGEPPSVEKSDYAKWMLEDPRVNFAISTRCGDPGISHLGLQVDTDAELRALEKKVAQASDSVLDEKDATCCYANSDKQWLSDPQGVVWEAFQTHGEAHDYGTAPGLSRARCC